ncbi:helix-turn-helix domain-containing protein [Altererythrobacter aurantiacus]|uniref:Helix-turn-helix domain-containing protein n=1 Tax=Parapontixanthobacter aurantiacus TaxID=1463599 RepID=A0A844ZDH6_9SPHN|nr:Crp/Fnr family transcriptional regulator [Parapontixanthobacter aurantiacus]MXO85818.1 helix-turn-helix domain-containing protein [Parapontixanthobacter aurantiacus]
MNDQRHPITGNFLRGRLRHALSEREQDLLESLFDDAIVTETNQVLMRRGEVSDYSTMLIDGFVLRTIDDEEEERIVGFQVPGDFMDLHAFALKRLDHNLVTLNSAKIAKIAHEKLERLMAEEPHLARILWFSTLLDAAIHREWIMKIGQLRALGRAAHFFSEINYRLQMVGRAGRHGFQTPLTQAHVANVCGTTPVHINRVLKDLRESGAADFRRGDVRIESLDKLHALGRFSPDYLYGEGLLAMTNEFST